MEYREGEYVSIENSEGELYSGTILTTKASSHVHGKDSETLERNMDNMEID